MNSKQIGNNYEREVAKKLSLWLTEGLSDDVCWRDLGSGNRATIRINKNKETIRQGDFVPVDLNYKWFFDLFNVDSKSYKAWNPIFINEKNMKSNSILNQWVKVCKDSKNKLPFMICKIRDNITPEFVIVNQKIKIPDDYKLNYIYYNFYNLDLENCFLFLLNDFFKIKAFDLYTFNK